MNQESLFSQPSYVILLHSLSFGRDVTPSLIFCPSLFPPNIFSFIVLCYLLLLSSFFNLLVPLQLLFFLFFSHPACSSSSPPSSALSSPGAMATAGNTSGRDNGLAWNQQGGRRGMFLGRTHSGGPSVFGQLLVPLLLAPRQTPPLNGKNYWGTERWTEREERDAVIRLETDVGEDERGGERERERQSQFGDENKL